MIFISDELIGAINSDISEAKEKLDLPENSSFKDNNFLFDEIKEDVWWRLIVLGFWFFSNLKKIIWYCYIFFIDHWNILQKTSTISCE